MRKFKRYQTNLSVVHDNGNHYIQSYSTKVAKINWDQRVATVNKWWSVTTSKHINYACRELGLTQIKTFNTNKTN